MTTGGVRSGGGRPQHLVNLAEKTPPPGGDARRGTGASSRCDPGRRRDHGGALTRSLPRTTQLAISPTDRVPVLANLASTRFFSCGTLRLGYPISHPGKVPRILPDPWMYAAAAVGRNGSS